jgi:hypothetical protein
VRPVVGRCFWRLEMQPESTFLRDKDGGVQQKPMHSVNQLTYLLWDQPANEAPMPRPGG